MRQRNDTGHVLPDVMAWPTDEHPGLRPFGVGPGEVIDHPTLLGGFTSLEPEADGHDNADGESDATGDDRASDGAEAGAAGETAQTRRTRKSAAATLPEGGERQ